MKPKSSPAKATTAKTSSLKKTQLRDLTAKQADDVRGGIKRTIRTGR